MSCTQNIISSARTQENLNPAQEFVQSLIDTYNPATVLPVIGDDGLYHFLYLTYHKESYNFYVGKHTTKNLGDGYIGSGKHFQRALKKHGSQSFSHARLLFISTEDEAYKKEAELVNEELIKKYREELKVCYNLQTGGKGGSVYRSQETRDKIGQAKKEAWDEKRMKNLEGMDVDVPSNEVLNRLNERWSFEQGVKLYHPDTFHTKVITFKLDSGKKNPYLDEDLKECLSEKIGFKFGTTTEEVDKSHERYQEIEDFLKELKEKSFARIRDALDEKLMKNLEGTDVAVPSIEVLNRLNERWTFEQGVKLYHPQTFHTKVLMLKLDSGKKNPYLDEDLKECLSEKIGFKFGTTTEEVDKSHERYQEIEDFLKELKEKSFARKGKAKADPKYKAKYSQAIKEAFTRPEVKAKHSQAMKEVHARPEVKAKYSQALKEAFAIKELVNPATCETKKVHWEEMKPLLEKGWTLTAKEIRLYDPKEKNRHTRVKFEEKGKNVDKDKAYKRLIDLLDEGWQVGKPPKVVAEPEPLGDWNGLMDFLASL